MTRTENTRSLSDSHPYATAHLYRLAKDGGAEVLTVDGEAKNVAMSHAKCDRGVDIAIAKKLVHAEGVKRLAVDGSA